MPPADGFRHATELIEFLSENYDLSIGAAYYPESHVESTSEEDDLNWTKVKAQNGAGFLISQLFFDTSHYFRFSKRAKEAGIDVPLVPGIMPITNVAQIERFTKMCGASIPEALNTRMQRFADNGLILGITSIQLAYFIAQFHHRGDGGVEGLATAVVVTDLGDSLMGFAPDGFLRVIQRC